MTAFGGTSNRGAVFSYDLASNAYEVIHSFDIPNGYQPQYGLVAIGATLYGTTVFGGDNDNGVLFSIVIPEPSGLIILSIAFACGRVRRHSMNIPCARPRR
jgi:uncharacterized repeat protein (TIGR03803 family)